MKLHLSSNEGRNAVTRYGPDFVEVNGIVHRTSLVVRPDAVTAPWDARSFDALAEPHFAALAAMRPEVVILGTGPRLRFPHPRLTRPLVEAGIGLEVMDLGAACRTYNILMAEDRAVAAALLLE